MGVTKSNQNNIKSPLGNSLALFVDYNDNQLKLKDIRGNVQGITDYVTGIPSGVLQLENGVPLDSTYRAVQDQNGNNSPLYMSLNGITAIGTGGIMTNTVFGSESFLYNSTGYENTILGWANAFSYSDMPLEFSGYGNVYAGTFNFSPNNAIRNVFIGYAIFNNSDTTTINCTDNIFIGQVADTITGVNDNNILIGGGIGNNSITLNCIGIGFDMFATSGASNSISIGLNNFYQTSGNNSIVIGRGNNYCVGTGQYNQSVNDISLGGDVLRSYASKFSTNNITIKTNSNGGFRNYPSNTQNSVNISSAADSTNLFGVQLGGYAIGNINRIQTTVDQTCTFVGSTYRESGANLPVINPRNITAIGAYILDSALSENSVLIGLFTGYGFSEQGGISNNVLIGQEIIGYKDWSVFPEGGYNINNSTIISTKQGATQGVPVTTVYTVQNYTALGFCTRSGLRTNTNNTLIGATTLTSAGLSTKSNCTSIGYNALRAMTSGTGNSTAIGSGALLTETTGINNTAIGATTVSGPTSQTHTLVGQGITNSVTTTAGVTIIGQGISNSSAGTGALILGKSAANTAATRAVIGSASVNAGAITVESLVSNTTWTVRINGTEYKMLLRA